MFMKRILSTLFLLAMCARALFAQAAAGVDGITAKDGLNYLMRGENLEVLTNSFEFTFDVVVSTNGTFTVANGTERRLGDGQILRRDGWLLSPDGSVQPVVDHLAVLEGKMYVVRDGNAMPLAQKMVFTNDLSVTPDGECRFPNGTTLRLRDGQLIRMDGSAIPPKDTITLRNGKVVVQKDGKMLTLLRGQVMGMSDGSKVYGDGAIQKGDGPTTKLHEGQTILVDGVVMKP
jgi:hypothetical protein